MYQIIFYKDESGKSDIQEYINELRNKKDTIKDCKIKYEKIDTYLQLLSRFGLKMGKPYIKHLVKDLWELRPLNDRIVIAHLDDNKIILLTHFVKKTRKTPKREIIKAEKLLNIIREECKNERKF